jgi:hypothetical protein
MVLRITLIAMVCFLTTTAIRSQTGGIIIPPGNTVTEEAGTTIDIKDGNLLLRDDYNHAPSFLQKGSIHFTGSGEAKVEQYLEKDVWHGISSPVQDEVNGAYMWIYMIEWREPTADWLDWNQPTNQTLTPGKGFYVWAYSTSSQWPVSPDSVVLAGTLNRQDISVTLSVTGSSTASGWNLIGNPFPVALDWNGNAAWNLSNVGATAWVWDPSAGNYKYWNYNTGGTLQSGEIAATQGFWVRSADTTGATGASLTLPASQRTHSTNDFYKNSGPIIPNQLKLKVQGSTVDWL